MQKHILTIALTSLLVASSAHSADPTTPGLIAGKPAPQKGDICRGISTFDCNLIGSGLTVKEIYQKGWRVVAAYYIPSSYLQNLIIEEQ